MKRQKETKRKGKRDKLEGANLINKHVKIQLDCTVAVTMWRLLSLILYINMNMIDKFIKLGVVQVLNILCQLLILT